jgi:hypothetical protein
MATNDPFAKERANLSAGIGDEAGNLSSALGLTPPIIKPRLPTGPKPIPTPNQIGNYPGGSVAPMSAPAPAPEQPPGSDADLSSVTSAMGSENVGAMRTAQGQAMQQAGELTGLAAMKKSENDILDATRNADRTRKDVEEVQMLESQREAKTGEYKAFAPTEESVKDLGMLFGLVSVAAFSSGGEGRYSGMAAMKNMSAAMQGYRQGRNDIFNKELKEYDKNMAALKSNNDLAQKTFDNAMKLMSVDKDAGIAEMKRLAAIDNNGMVAMQVRAGRFDEAGKILGHTANALEKEQEKRAALQETAARNAETIRRNKEMEALARDRVNNRQTKYGTLYIDPTDGTPYQQNLETGEYEVAVGLPKGIQKVGAPGSAGKGANVSGTAAGQVERLTQSMTQVSGAIKSLASLPVVTTGPMFAEKNFGSIFTAPLSALNQGMSAESAQMLQTRMAGVARNLASLETGGAATGLVGLTQSIQDGVGIKANAKLHVALDKLAEMRRIVDDSARAVYASSKYTEEQKKLVRQNVEIVHTAIPFTQEDITNALKVSEGKSPKIPKEDRNLSFTEFVEKYGMGKTEEPASKEGRSKARPGEKVLEDANGNKAVLRNNVYVEVE